MGIVTSESYIITLLYNRKSQVHCLILEMPKIILNVYIIEKIINITEKHKLQLLQLVLIPSHKKCSGHLKIFHSYI